MDPAVRNGHRLFAHLHAHVQHVFVVFALFPTTGAPTNRTMERKELRIGWSQAAPQAVARGVDREIFESDSGEEDEPLSVVSARGAAREIVFETVEGPVSSLAQSSRGHRL